GGTGPAVSAPALRAIRRHLGMDVAFLSEFVDGRRVFRAVDAAGADPPVRVGEGGPLEESYCQRVVDGRLPELIHDARAVPAAAELPATHSLPVGAHLSVPVRLADGRVYGTFCCFSTTPDLSLNERDLAMMRVFAELTAAQIDADRAAGRRRTEAAARVRSAMAGEGLSMVYQPIVDIDRRRPVGFEALARFSARPPRGPDAWFAEAGEAGLGVELELAAVALALRGRPRLPPDAYLALNVSPATVLSGRLDALLADRRADHVVLEITEHEAVGSYERLDGALAGLRRSGVRVAVDDAGAGYASFRHILRVRPDVIKLDMSLTRRIDEDGARRALALALVRFAAETGSDLVAEGVETAGELRTLRDLGATVAQGNLLGHPADGARLSRSGVPGGPLT
ncbi:MAG: sensor domain-containing phosphodiesterase, partial [Acidimicrobiales bacterium]